VKQPETHGEITVLDEAAVAGLLPVRGARSHKGTHGTVLILAGSLDHLGAALLCSLAAVRAGAGLVRLAVPASLQPIVAGRIPEIVTMGLHELSVGEVEPLEALARLEGSDADALVVGPGLLAGPGTDALVGGLVGGQGVPAVLDAEALNRLAARDGWWLKERADVLTPHPGEFARLDGRPVGDADDERAGRAREAAIRWRRVVVLKGARTVIAAPDGRVCRAPFENAALATAGTGDVLAGTIGAYLAQRLASYDAARVGVYLHGAAAGRLSERMGDAGVLASELPAAIARVRRDLAASRQGRSSRLRVASRTPSA
jgi:NAD(P)H-hydrate epimerase